MPLSAMAPHRIIMPHFFRPRIAKGKEEGGEREREEESLQLLAHVLATAITDTNDPRVKHAKLSHRSFLEPVCLGVRETETKLGRERRKVSLSLSLSQL